MLRISIATKELSDNTYWACGQTGINPNDLYERQLADFQRDEKSGAEVPGDIAMMRFENFEKRRRTKMRILVEFIR